ncbi:MAG: RidA family protein [Alphaproteobacteria bacterium]|nr:RidA family protein [Alphaproteobacteria bacterium]
MARFDQVVYADRALEEKLGFPRFVRSAGVTVHMSGILSADESFNLVGRGDMSAQVHRIYTRFEAYLKHLDATLQNVVSEILFTTDLKALTEASHVRSDFYRRAQASKPASTAVQVAALALDGAMLEIHPVIELPR